MGENQQYGSGLFGNEPILALPESYYTSLVTSEYQPPSSPKFNAFLALLLGKFQDVTNCLETFAANFNLETAQGAQLDILGSIVGANRQVGFQPSNGVSPILNDATYLIYIKYKIVQNQWNGTIPGFYSAVNAIFAPNPPPMSITIADQQDMTADIIVTGASSSILTDLVNNGYIVPRPETVLYNYGYSTYPIFAFDSPNVHGPILLAYVGASGGASYVVGDVLTIVQAGASGGTVLVGALSGSAVSAISLRTPGTGYSNANNLSVTGGSGIGAQISIVTSYKAGFDVGLWS